MVWEGIMKGGRIQQRNFDERSVTRKRYVEKVVEPHVRLFKIAVEPDYLLLVHNFVPHRASLVPE